MSISFFLVTFFVGYFLHRIKSLEKENYNLNIELSHYRVDSTITNSVNEENKKSRDIFKEKYDSCQMEKEKLKIEIKELEKKKKK